MINVKDQVYAKLVSVCENTSDVYPQTWEKLPSIQYTEEANNCYTKTDGKEQYSTLRYRVDIWNNGSTSQMAIDVDAALSELGLVRTMCQDVSDPSGLRHKQMRFEGVIDNETELVYWEGNR